MALLTRRMAAFRRETGAELIEFAFTLPLLLVVVMGIVDFGFMMQRFEVVSNAAREGARVAILPGYEDSDVIDRVDQYVAAAGLPGSAMTVVTDRTVTAGTRTFDAKQVTVSFTHVHQFVGPLMTLVGGAAMGSTPLTANVTMRTESQAGP